MARYNGAEYLYVDRCKDVHSYQILVSGELWKFPDGNAAAKPVKVFITADEIRKLVSKPLSRRSLWQRCHLLYEMCEGSRRHVEPLLVSEQEGLTFLIEDASKYVRRQIR